METIYLDNAATSFPKPDAMLAAMVAYQRNTGANPGRSGHGRSIDAGRIIYETRDALARLFHGDDPLCIALTKNSTEALNIALQDRQTVFHADVHLFFVELDALHQRILMLPQKRQQFAIAATQVQNMRSLVNDISNNLMIRFHSSILCHLSLMNIGQKIFYQSCFILNFY